MDAGVTPGAGGGQRVPARLLLKSRGEGVGRTPLSTPPLRIWIPELQKKRGPSAAAGPAAEAGGPPNRRVFDMDRSSIIDGSSISTDAGR